MMSSEERQSARSAAARERVPRVESRPRRSGEASRRQLDRLAAELHAELGRRWPSYYPESAEKAPAIALSPRHCGFSVIFKADLDFARGEHKSLIIKIRREQKHGSVLRADLSERTLALSLAEYEEHLKAYQFFLQRSDELSVVRPLDFIASHNALVVEHAAGSDLATLAKQGGPLASRSIRRCGQWWRLFHHELHQARNRGWDPAMLDAGLDWRLSRLRDIGAPRSALDDLYREITAAARRAPAAAVPESVVHGDCKLRHVWATPRQIQVLDFGNAKSGCSWIDPAALVVELSLYSLWTRHLDSGSKVADIRTLLHAYFEGQPPAAFSFYVVDCLLKKWHRRLRSWGPGAGLTRIRRSLQAAGLDKGIERLYVDRWFSGQIRAWLALADGRPPRWLRPVVE